MAFPTYFLGGSRKLKSMTCLRSGIRTEYSTVITNKTSVSVSAVTYYVHTLVTRLNRKHCRVLTILSARPAGLSSLSPVGGFFNFSFQGTQVGTKLQDCIYM